MAKSDLADHISKLRPDVENLTRSLYRVEILVGKNIAAAVELLAHNEEQAFTLARNKLRFKTQKLRDAK